MPRPDHPEDAPGLSSQVLPVFNTKVQLDDSLFGEIGVKKEQGQEEKNEGEDTSFRDTEIKWNGDWSVPTLSLLGIKEPVGEERTPFRGGETEGLLRMVRTCNACSVVMLMQVHT